MNDSPSLLLFLCDGNYYCYDRVKNNVYKISCDTFKELSILKELGFKKYAERHDNSNACSEVKQLISLGFISSLTIDCTHHKNEVNIPYLLKRGLSQLQLQVTKDCNFHCRYCIYARNSQIGRPHCSKKMTWATAKKSIDFLYGHSMDSDEITIYFYGGEPLMNQELIFKSVDYANKIFLLRKITYVITTNGALLNDEIVSFFEENDFHVIISFDGPKEIQNKHRQFNFFQGSYDIVKSKIDFIKKYHYEFYRDNVKFNAVVMPDENSTEIYTFFERVMEKDTASVNIINADLHGIDYDNSALKVFDLQSDIFLYDDAEREKTNFLSVYNDKRQLQSNWEYMANCVPGALRLFVDVDGNFFPCEKVPECESVCIGNIESGIDVQKVTLLTGIKSFVGAKCGKCWAIRFCKMCICHFMDSVVEDITDEMVELACKREKSRIKKELMEYIADGSK